MNNVITPDKSSLTTHHLHMVYTSRAPGAC